jgi:multicomponent Na+:H+ antiporter subunit D
MDSSAWAAWSVALPLAAAAVAIGGWRAGRIAAYLTATLAPIVAFGTLRAVGESGPLRHPLGGWGAPLGIELHVDGLSALMLAATAVVGAATTLYAGAYFTRATGRWFWVVWLLLWTSLNGVFVSDDVFNLYVMLELLGLSAVALVALAATRDATVAAMRYFLVSMAGSLLFLLGVALLYARYGTLSLTLLSTLAEPDAASLLALSVMSLGMMAKTAIFPLHAWLPPAHASAPTPASAVLSGLVVKASFYVLLRLWLHVFGVAGGGYEAALLVLGILGAGAVLWGSVLALRQRTVKLLVAYSTVAQLGYLFILFPLIAAAGPWAETAWHGGIYHVISHACAKASMFLAAGSMVKAVGADRLPALAGIGHRLPISFTAFGIGGLSLVGMPPSGGFIAKWLLLSAALGSGSWIWALVLVLGSVLAAGYVFLVLRHAFEWSPEATRPTHPVPRRMEAAALLLALVALGLGFVAVLPLDLLGPLPGAAP